MAASPRRSRLPAVLRATALVLGVAVVFAACTGGPSKPDHPRGDKSPSPTPISPQPTVHGEPPCPGEFDPSTVSQLAPPTPVAAAHHPTITTVGYTSSDGQPVSALLGVPDGPGPFPAVVRVHGGFGKGPEASEIGFLVEAGYVAIDPDYRQNAIGGAEVDDVVAAVTYLRSRPDVIHDRIAIMGTSHGATIAALAVERNPGLFRSLVWIAGAADWACIDRLYTGTGVGNTIERSMGGLPSQVYKTYVERSPVFHVGSVDVPVYAAQSISDDSVPIGQGQVFVDALRAAGKQVIWNPSHVRGHRFLDKEAIGSKDWQYLLDFLAQTLG